ncbi:uncharacterized protein EDB91DRAFT_1271489 [Suillus paluster]|uniref:uncharacterized protein n=1 Tax=Suillus paluster TaxID=48578 RepID=UPI001B863A79|nr:uncharacterized protein EDB91DRAFT_1271489 [Suillus paluster]KAG1745020.1 hypothetical protein EDB91DRAFT_1271489 [Suillus paluster]
MPDTAASRKFIDLILQTSSKWANWDPPIEIKVGHFGTIDRTSGELEVEGNIYDAAFQESLNQQGLKIDLSDPSFQPIKGAIEEDIIMCSTGVKKGDFSLKPEVSLLNLASASVKAEFQFQDGKRGAVLVMHKPQQQYIPQGRLLGIVHKANELKDKYIVNSTFTCPGYYLYLSNKSGERVALALTANALPAAIGVTAGGGASVDWWTNVQAAFLRKAFDKAGQYRYTPLYSLKRRQNWFQRAFRGEEEHMTEDDLWPNCPAPWDPLDEDGNEDSVYEETDEDLFARQSAVEGSLPFTSSVASEAT